MIDNYFRKKEKFVLEKGLLSEIWEIIKEYLKQQVFKYSNY